MHVFPDGTRLRVSLQNPGLGHLSSEFLFPTIKMSRGGSAGGGQSSLGYLFGSGEPPKPAVAPAVSAPPAAAGAPPAEKPPAAKPDGTSQIAAGVTSQTNNYHRADGQNTGNFLTDRPSTKVHAAPGGGSSLGYLFGGN
uniref:Protein SPIRAL1-like 1 n=1 Tax=Zea mays TaxID=4577 RepID=A0A804LLW1_MAIZE